MCLKINRIYYSRINSKKGGSTVLFIFLPGAFLAVLEERLQIHIVRQFQLGSKFGTFGIDAVAVRMVEQEPDLLCGEVQSDHTTQVQLLLAQIRILFAQYIYDAVAIEVCHILQIAECGMG